MRWIARGTVTFLIGTSVAFAQPAVAVQGEIHIAASSGRSTCEQLSCQVREAFVIFPLPSSVTHYPCDASGQAPAGAIDETADLQAWIDSVPDGGGTSRRGSTEWNRLVFPTNRCIRMDGQLRIRDRHNLVFEGGDLTLDQHLKPANDISPKGSTSWRGSGGWQVIRGSFLQWNSFKIVGNHQHSQTATEWSGGNTRRATKVATYGFCHDSTGRPRPGVSCEWQAAWSLMGSQHVILENNESRDTHGDGVAIEWGPGINVMPRDITISNHRIYRTGRQGISAIAGEDITIINSYIEGAASNAIDLEPGRWEDDRFPIRRVTITHNRFGESFAATLAANGVCAELSDVSYTYNEQLEPNITNRPALEMIAPEVLPITGQRCSRQRGPVVIRNNTFRIRETGSEGDLVLLARGYSKVTFSSNSTHYACHPATPGCSADQSLVSLIGGSGHALSGNSTSTGASPP